MTTAFRAFGKLNSARPDPSGRPGARGEPSHRRRLPLLGFMLVFAFGSALVARFPFLGSFSWWFGRDPQAAYHVAIAVVGLGVLGAVNFIDTQRRRARFREREQNAGPGEIVLPDWCHDYTSCGDGGDGGSGGGGDGGGGD